MKRSEICPHWNERDDEDYEGRYISVEWCDAAGCGCTCFGLKSDCSHPEELAAEAEAAGEGDR